MAIQYLHGTKSKIEPTKLKMTVLGRFFFEI